MDASGASSRSRRGALAVGGVAVLALVLIAVAAIVLTRDDDDAVSPGSSGAAARQAQVGDAPAHPFMAGKAPDGFQLASAGTGTATPQWGEDSTGTDEPYTKIPYFFSDQYDVGMEYAGYAVEWDEVVFRGDVEGREFIAFWLKDGRLLAGMNVNVWDVTDDIQALIRSGAQVDPARLRDPDVELASLA